MARDWAAVAQAMKSRLAELGMTRELLFNAAQRRRSDQTLAAASAALGWPPGYLRAVSEGRDPGAADAGNPVLTELAALKERLGSIEQGLRLSMRGPTASSGAWQNSTRCRRQSASCRPS